MRVCERGNCDLFPRCRYIFMSLLFGNFRAAAFPRPLDIWRVRKTHFPRMENWFGPPIFSVFIFRARVDRLFRVYVFLRYANYSIRVWKGVHAFQTCEFSLGKFSCRLFFRRLTLFDFIYMNSNDSRMFSVRVYSNSLEVFWNINSEFIRYI